MKENFFKVFSDKRNLFGFIVGLLLVVFLYSYNSQRNLNKINIEKTTQKVIELKEFTTNFSVEDDFIKLYMEGNKEEKLDYLLKYAKVIKTYMSDSYFDKYIASNHHMKYLNELIKNNKETKLLNHKLLKKEIKDKNIYLDFEFEIKIGDEIIKQKESYIFKSINIAFKIIDIKTETIK
ncbi:hypothetical protein WG909_13245 [Peptostreptococcaceae bacterium AGR-M142]